MPPAPSAGQRVFRPCSSRLANRSPEVSPATMPRRKASASCGNCVETGAGFMAARLADQAAGARRDERQHRVDVAVDARVVAPHGLDLGPGLLQRLVLA